ncbi:MAG: MTH1187 family thiamine-binding protein [Aquificae bacterium]|nr:MTH1187 family thiamine-binding protein [Aquificota bacterium]
MSYLVSLSIFPTDKGESVSPYVSKVIKLIKESGLPYKLTPMSTIVEVEDINEVFKLMDKAYKILQEEGCNRIYTVMTVDYRKGKSNRMEQKVRSVEQKIGEVNKV